MRWSVLGHGVFWRGGRLNGEIAHGLLLGLVVGSISGGNQGAACVGEISLVSARLAVVGVGIGGHGMVWLEKATNDQRVVQQVGLMMMTMMMMM